MPTYTASTCPGHVWVQTLRETEWTVSGIVIDESCLHCDAVTGAMPEAYTPENIYRLRYENLNTVSADIMTELDAEDDNPEPEMGWECDCEFCTSQNDGPEVLLSIGGHLFVFDPKTGQSSFAD